MAEAAGTAFCLVQLSHWHPLGLLVPGNYHLGYALAVVYDERLIAQVDQNHADLSAIVGIYCAWRIQHGDAMLYGESASGAYLCLYSGRQGDEEPRGDEASLHRPELDGRRYVCTKVEAGALRRGILWQRMVAAVYHLNLHLSCLYIKVLKSNFLYASPETG